MSPPNAGPHGEAECLGPIMELDATAGIFVAAEPKAGEMLPLARPAIPMGPTADGPAVRLPAIPAEPAAK